MTRPLELRGVWKAYPRWAPGMRTLRAVVSRRAPVLLRRGDRRWALRDVSLTVEPGEAVGVIGANGAGKSTLLRLASGLGRATRGEVVAHHDVASVLSLGSWFDLQLTGRENAETAAIVLGATRREAAARVSAALDFADLHEFADAPVRIYSDGMRLRLAFGVLAQTRPALLVVDEALAVGDLAFQAQCLERIGEMRAAGSALLLASHDLDQVADQCDRALWLQAGEVRGQGTASAIVSAYRDAGRAETLARTPPGVGQDRWGSQEVVFADAALRSLDPVCVELALERRSGDPGDVQVKVELRRQDGEPVQDAVTQLRLGGDPLRLQVSFEHLVLAPGDYIVCAGAYPRDWSYAYDYRWRLLATRVAREARPRWRTLG